MRIIMLNDMAWAGTTSNHLTDKQLKELGNKECRQRGWVPYADWERGTIPVSLVSVRVKKVKNISSYRPEQCNDY